MAETGRPDRAAVPTPTGADRAARGRWRPASRRLAVGLLLAATATAFETLAVAPVLPAVVADLGTLVLYGWAFSAFLLAMS